MKLFIIQTEIFTKYSEVKSYGSFNFETSEDHFVFLYKNYNVCISIAKHKQNIINMMCNGNTSPVEIYFLVFAYALTVLICLSRVWILVQNDSVPNFSEFQWPLCSYSNG